MSNYLILFVPDLILQTTHTVLFQAGALLFVIPVPGSKRREDRGSPLHLSHDGDRGYYTVARRYEFYFRVARTISHSFAALTREILFLPQEHKIHIFELSCNVLFII